MGNKNHKQCSHGYFSHNNCTDQDDSAADAMFDLILNSEDGDYAALALLAADMKPNGW